MIKINNGELEISAESVQDLMMEMAALMKAVASEIVSKSEATNEIEVIEDIVNAIKFADLVERGLSEEDAIKAMGMEVPQK